MSKYKVGDRVRVRKPANIYQFPNWTDRMDCFDGTEQEISKVNVGALHHTVHFAKDSCNYYFHFDWLEPVEPMQSWVPQGYTVIPMAVPDEMAKQLYADSGTVLVWKPPKLGMNYLCPTTSHVRCATEDFWECYPTATYTTVPSEQYRDPTQADVGKMVEVSDCQEMGFATRELLAVISDQNLYQRFVCRDRCNGRHALTWKYARIKITPDTP